MTHLEQPSDRMTRLSKVAGLAVAIALVTALLGVSAAGAAPARPSAGCTTVVQGAAWKITSLGSGTGYTLKAFRMSCATARSWVVTFSKETQTSGTLKGPAGFRCVSLASRLSGDTHVYDGECQKGTPSTAIFLWAPKP
jgi:hypothetical protein